MDFFRYFILLRIGGDIKNVKRRCENAKMPLKLHYNGRKFKILHMRRLISYSEKLTAFLMLWQNVNKSHFFVPVAPIGAALFSAKSFKNLLQK